MSFEKFNQPKQEESNKSDLRKNSALFAGVVAASFGAVELKNMADEGLEAQDTESHAIMQTPLSSPDELSASIAASVEAHRKDPSQPLIIKIPESEMAEAQMHVDMIEGAPAERIQVDLNEKIIPVTLNEKPIHVDKIEH
jgi:hypothetical protein